MVNVPTVIATGAILAAVYNIVQPLVDPLLPKAAAQHDALTRLLVILIGAVVGFVQYALVANAITGHDAAQAILSGCAEGLTAIATYHLAGDNMGGQTPAAEPVASFALPWTAAFTPSDTHIAAGLAPAPKSAPTAAPAPAVAPTPIVLPGANVAPTAPAPPTEPAT